MHKRIHACRICRTTSLETLLNLGESSFTGVFPKVDEPDVPKAPLELVKCSRCHLVQLAHSFDPHQMYGENYGYRSGLNQSMVRHLQAKVAAIIQNYHVKPGDFIIDIGSNDSTLLRSYGVDGLTRVGVDPSGNKFKRFYPSDVTLIPDFFSKANVERVFPNARAKVITSIAMFYDLEEPQLFVNEVASLLAQDGVWVFEQSYMPTMLEQNAYDTICHEHLEYYGMRQILWMTEAAGLKILDIEFNDVNGGSFSVTAARKDSVYPANEAKLNAVLQREEAMGLHTLRPYQEFAKRVEQHRVQLKEAIENINSRGLKVFGYGASTKGNVVLQYAELTSDDIPFVAEVNEDKFGCKTPGSEIPIISEADAQKLEPDFYLVLPWHFREGIVRREKETLERGTRFLFPLPHLECVSDSGVMAVEQGYPWTKPVPGKGLDATKPTLRS